MALWAESPIHAIEDRCGAQERRYANFLTGGLASGEAAVTVACTSNFMRWILALQDDIDLTYNSAKHLV